MKKFIFALLIFFSVFCLVDAQSENQYVDVIKDEEIYYKINTLTDSLGKVIFEEEVEITEEEYENLIETLSTTEKCSIGNACIQTAMKRLSLTINGTRENCNISLNVHYFNMPQYRSYDVIALRWEGFQMNSFNGKQLGKINGNNSTVTYNSSSSNSKIATNGVGISMNLYDEATFLELSLNVTGVITGNTMNVYGTYQHAQGNLTLSESKSYLFSSNGLGNVLFYSDSNIRNMYDNMDGVKIEGFNF